MRLHNSGSMPIPVLITQAANQRMKELGKTFCSVSIAKGGCYGYRVSLSFEAKGKEIYVQDGISVFLDCPEALTENSDQSLGFEIDFTKSLMKSGFVIKSLSSSNCCCNKSFRAPGIRVDKGNCIS